MTRTYVDTTSGASHYTAGGSSSSTSVRNMSDGNEKALDALIAQLQGGGTAYMKQQQAARTQEIANVQQQRQQYSKEAAFNDAQGAMAAQLGNAMNQALASLTRSAEGAGTSGSALRALLLQNAQQKAADSAATLGLQASVNYGQVAGGMNNTLEALTRVNDPVTEALLKALELARGVNTTTTSSGSSSGSKAGGLNVIAGGSAPSKLPDSSSFWKQFDDSGRPKIPGGYQSRVFGATEPLAGDSPLSGLSSY